MDAVDKIKEFKKQHNYSNVDLADRFDIPDKRIGDLLSRKYDLTKVDKLLPIARGMGVSLEYLADDAQGWPPPVRVQVPDLSPEEFELVMVARKLTSIRTAIARILADPLYPTVAEPGAAPGAVPRPIPLEPGDLIRPASGEQPIRESEGRPPRRASGQGPSDR